MVGLYTFVRDVDQGQPLTLLIEPWERFSSYTRGIGWGKPQPRILEYHAGGNTYSRYVIKLFEFFHDAD
jgi:hypothetical protein